MRSWRVESRVESRIESEVQVFTVIVLSNPSALCYDTNVVNT